MDKTCTKCNITKNIDDFGKRKDSVDGHRNECKECRKIGVKNSLFLYVKFICTLLH